MRSCIEVHIRVPVMNQVTPLYGLIIYDVIFQNYLCPDCNLGFIEKLHDSPAATSPFTDRSSENREDLDSASV